MHLTFAIEFIILFFINSYGLHKYLDLTEYLYSHVPISSTLSIYLRLILQLNRDYQFYHTYTR